MAVLDPDRSLVDASETTGCSAGPGERSCSDSDAARGYYFVTAG